MWSKLASELAFMTQGVQIISLIGAILVLSSFLCRGEKNLRLVNAIGSVFCITYSILVEPKQWSNFILNVVLISINSYYLIKGNMSSTDKTDKDSNRQGETKKEV